MFDVTCAAKRELNGEKRNISLRSHLSGGYGRRECIGRARARALSSTRDFDQVQGPVFDFSRNGRTVSAGLNDTARFADETDRGEKVANIYSRAARVTYAHAEATRRENSQTSQLVTFSL